MKIITTLNKIPKVFYFAVLLRLLIMPFMAHSDIIQTYRRAEHMAFQGRSIFTHTDALSHLIEAANLKFFSLFLGSDFFTIIHSGFNSLDQINTFLFIFKLPYLIAEILFWIVLYKYLVPATKKNLYLVLFNPIIIYSIYMFGRYESFVLLIISLALVALKKNKTMLFNFFMALFPVTRFSLLLIYPSILFSKLNMKKMITSLLFLGSTVLLYLFLNRSVALSKTATDWVSSGNHTNYMYAAQLDLGHTQILYIFVIFLTFLFLKLFSLWQKGVFKNEKNYVLFSLSALVILYLYYGLSVFHPQYFVWQIPFLMILINRFKHLNLHYNFVLMSVLFLAIPFFWGNKTTFELLLPTSSIFAYVDIYNFNLIYPLSKIASIFKSILSGVLLYTLYQLFSEFSNEKN